MISSDRTCPRCGNPILLRWPSDPTKYCSQVCRYEDKSRYALDTELKRRFIIKVRRIQITVAQASTSAGTKAQTIYRWLEQEGRRLGPPNLPLLAHWLRITESEANELQGGSVHEHKHARSVAVATQHRERMQRNTAYKTNVGRKISKALYGGTRTDEQRKNISAALKRSYELPDAPKRFADNGTLRGRAQKVLTNFRRHHPNWTDQQARDAAIARLLGEPYNVPTKREAWELLAPRWKHHTHRRGGPESLEHRHDILDAIDAEYPRTERGNRRPEAWNEFLRRVEEVEGPGCIDKPTAQSWEGHHPKHCTRIDQRRRST